MNARAVLYGFFEDGLFGAKGAAGAGAQHQQFFTLFDGGRAVRHDEDGAAFGLVGADRGVKRDRALVVEVRVRLVQDDQNGIAKERPRKADALQLPSRQ